MRALGAELGVDPMAAYNHIPNKAALLDGVVEAVWADLELPETDALDEAETLAALGSAMRDTLRRHPNAVPLVGSRPNRGNAGLQVADRAMAALTGAGVSASDAIAFVNAASSFVIGHTMCEVAQSPATDTQLIASIRDAIDARDHPTLARAFGDVDDDAFSDDRAFDLGLRSMIAGMLN